MISLLRLRVSCGVILRYVTILMKMQMSCSLMSAFRVFPLDPRQARNIVSEGHGMFWSLCMLCQRDCILTRSIASQRRPLRKRTGIWVAGFVNVACLGFRVGCIASSLRVHLRWTVGKKQSLGQSSAYPPLLGLAFAKAQEECKLRVLACNPLSLLEFAKHCASEILVQLPPVGQHPWKVAGLKSRYSFMSWLYHSCTEWLWL